MINEMVNPVFLRTFLVLCEQRSFTKTATELHMTQPGVSQHLRWLEEYFATELIVRTGRRFDLTDAGVRLQNYAEQLFAEHLGFVRELRVDDPHSGVIRLSSPGSFGTKMFGFLTELRRRHPGLEVHYEMAPNQSVVAAMLAGELDLGFINHEPASNLQLEAWPVDKERLCLVVPKTFRGRSFEAYQQLGFVDHPDGAYYLDQIMPHLFADQYRDPRDFAVQIRVNSLAMICDPVAAGIGFTALPEYACKAYPHQDRIRYSSPAGLPLDTIYAIARPHVPRPARIDYVLSEFAKL